MNINSKASEGDGDTAQDIASGISRDTVVFVNNEVGEASPHAEGRATRPFFISLSLGAIAVLLLTLLRRGDVGLGVALADALFAASAVLLGVGAMIYVYLGGFFDIFSYSLRALTARLFGRMLPDYREYRQRRRSSMRCGGIALAGAVYLLLSFVLSVFLVI